MIQDKYLNPFTDFGFKKLFGEEDSKVYLVDFLNSILESQLATPIVSIETRQNEMLGRAVTDRSAVFDLYCMTQNGDRIIVEMQKAKQEYFRDRTLYYSTFAITEQAKKGRDELTYKKWDFKLDPVYCIGILNFNFSDKEKYLHIGKIQDVDDHDTLIDNMTFAFIEMKKFAKSIENCKTKQDKWLYTIYNIAKLQEVPQELSEQVFIDFFHKAEVNALTTVDLGEYYDSMRQSQDFYIISTENLARGKNEGKAEVALNLKKTGLLTLEQIAEASGLTIEEIKSLI
jgi:predicted transposase/invertase (TIGR01784 family)